MAALAEALYLGGWADKMRHNQLFAFPGDVPWQMPTTTISRRTRASTGPLKGTHQAA
ncbi:hypothetical protein NOVOSPHI9U_420036 [Novosphingobium sp. 9U]|nr:hypothetical protein NOVOSPHI9U_420036 [Novosphingobium sp. 9U]